MLPLLYCIISLDLGKNVEIFTVYLPWAVSLDGHLCLSNSPPFNLHLLYSFCVIRTVLIGK